jgi:hypothetical protein
MDWSLPRRRPHYLTLGTALALLVLPVLAAHPAAWPGLVGLTLATMLALVLLWVRTPLTTAQVLWGAVLLRLAFLPLMPGLTDDLYRYIWDGWIQMHGINPYRYVPQAEALSRFQSSVLFDRMNSPAYYSVYPPLLQWVFALAGGVYALDWTVSYYVLKGLFTGAELGGVILLSRLTSARNLLLYAWNPVVLLEVAGQGHAEALLVPSLLGLVWAVRTRRPRVASIAVAAAGLVKLYPFVLWPFLWRRDGWTAVWPGLLVCAGLSLPYAAPYTLPHLKASVDLFVSLMEFNAGPYYLVKHTLWTLTGADWSKVIGPIFRYAFLGLLPLLYVLDWRRDGDIVRAVLGTIGLFYILSPTVHPWYLVPMVALAVIPARPVWPWLWLATFSVGTYLFYVDGSYWTWIVLGWGGAALLAIERQLGLVSRGATGVGDEEAKSAAGPGRHGTGYAES